MKKRTLFGYCILIMQVFIQVNALHADQGLTKSCGDSSQPKSGSGNIPIN